MNAHINTQDNLFALTTGPRTKLVLQSAPNGGWVIMQRSDHGIEMDTLGAYTSTGDMLAALSVALGAPIAPLEVPVPAEVAARAGTARIPRRGRRNGSTTKAGEGAWMDLREDPLALSIRQISAKHDASASIVQAVRCARKFLAANGVDPSKLTWAQALDTCRSLGYRPR